MCFCFSPQTHALYTQLEEITPAHNSLEILKSTSDPFLSCNIIPNECVPEIANEIIIDSYNKNDVISNKENFNVENLPIKRKRYSLEKKTVTKIARQINNCNKCQRDIFDKVITCIICKLRFCSSCAGDEHQLEFICDICFSVE